MTCCAVLMFPAVVAAQSGPSCSERMPESELNELRARRPLVCPSRGYPALVRPGQRLDVALGSCSGGSRTDRWRVVLKTGGEVKARLMKVRYQQKDGSRGLHGVVPADTPRGVYHLQVNGPGCVTTEPNAVRVLGAARGKPFRFAVFTDHQFLDPSHVKGKESNSGQYPRKGSGERNIAITLQGFDELALWDPDFVLHTGDLVFGLDYSLEYPKALKLLDGSRLPMFAVPGNHDAYAIHKVALKRPSLSRILGCVLEIGQLLRKLDLRNFKATVTGAIGAIIDRDWNGFWAQLKAMAVESWKFSRDAWPKVWHTIFKVAKCLWANFKTLLYGKPHQDGLDYWRNNLGPTEYSFDRGRFRFIAVNTYQGSKVRRHSFTIQVSMEGKPIGVPFADNFGGYIPAQRLQALEAQVKQAVEQGKVPVLFGHHNPAAEAHTVNVKYPAGEYRFQEWNYYGKGCLKIGEPGCKKETAAAHSGIQLLRILATYGGYYLCGHSHADDWQVVSGTIRGVKVLKPFTIIRTTTAASSGKWGYRILEASGNEIRPVGRTPGDRASIPTGNLWTSPGETADTMYLHSALPRPVKLTVSMDLPASSAGYRFVLGDNTAEAATAEAATARIRDLHRTGDRTRYWLRVTVPGANAGEVRRVQLKAHEATGNKAPLPAITDAAGEGPASASKRLVFSVGNTVSLSAAASRDPEGKALVKHVWYLDGNPVSTRAELLLDTSSPKTHEVRLMVFDEAGAFASASVQVVLEETDGGSSGDGDQDTGGGKGFTWFVVLLMLALVGGVAAYLWHLRRSRKR